MGIIKEPETGKIWLKHHIDILRQWKAKTFIYLWLHDHSTYYYASLNNWLSYPIILISTVCSAAVISTNDYRVHIIMGVLTMLNAILTGFNRQMNPGSLMQQHALLNRRYGNLIRSIDTCLSLTEKMRPHPSVFIERVGVEIDNLADNNIDFPDYILTFFEREFGPLDRLLYGENIVELVKIGKTTNSIVNDVRRKSQLIFNDDNNDTITIESGDIETGFETNIMNTQQRPMLPFKLLAGGHSTAMSFAMSIRPALAVFNNGRMSTDIDQSVYSARNNTVDSPHFNFRTSGDGMDGTNHGKNQNGPSSGPITSNDISGNGMSPNVFENDNIRHLSEIQRATTRKSLDRTKLESMMTLPEEDTRLPNPDLNNLLISSTDSDIAVTPTTIPSIRRNMYNKKFKDLTINIEKTS